MLSSAHGVRDKGNGYRDQEQIQGYNIWTKFLTNKLINKHLLSSNYVPGNMLGSGDIKTKHKILISMSYSGVGGEWRQIIIEIDNNRNIYIYIIDIIDIYN